MAKDMHQRLTGQLLAQYMRKSDGSIIKLWYDNVLGWNTSTNETINRLDSKYTH